MISASGLDCPIGSIALSLHWARRLLLVMLPCFSTEEAQGSIKTSVCISLGFAPGPFQKEPVSLSKRFTLTIHLTLERAFLTFPAFEPEQAGFWPQAKKPSNLSLSIWSKSTSHEPFCPSSSFGSNEYPKSLSGVALFPYIAFR